MTQSCAAGGCGDARDQTCSLLTDTASSDERLQGAELLLFLAFSLCETFQQITEYSLL